ncbi:protein-(glutamine-N5) methyltransferase, release factor-specific [Lachnoanaerobaculum sp. ICM7]|jgi:protein-(glutamine-N5) methyltransferase, release factor-specific|uniref:peptide chain release factor N(5)-glutamine methyltransferase n=1 Tax=Lachnoanaerobaculum sp. ICM7 TaxID=936594 RepID=UPI00027A5236|nr:peptide chain release factor N(5)-glutamine methyltransferase [Lachnoanaerobaculum sp. ICM7]EJP19108.1 protein-(glutamine-N5) methyltransferase, release factor-specific [Lachnoanaerobaculum sp. ICM7]
MKYIEAFDKYVKLLEEKNFKDAKSDILLLIYEIFDFDFSKWTMYKYDEIEDISKLDTLNKYVKKRLGHMPIQYILNKAYFCGLPLYVNENVLIPRFDTEVLVEEVLKISKKDKSKRILDICTGSGAIAIALKKLGGFERVDALDISDKALEVAKRNANELDLNINFLKSDMFSSLTCENKYDIIVSNPPYIQSDVVDTLESEVKDFEPRLALDGDADGMKFYKIIAENYEDYLVDNGVLALEIGYDEANDIRALFEGKNVVIKKDLANLDRVAIIYS